MHIESKVRCKRQQYEKMPTHPIHQLVLHFNTDTLKTTSFADILHNDTPIGRIDFNIDYWRSDIAFIDKLQIKPSFQSKGIGECVYEHLEQRILLPNGIHTIGILPVYSSIPFWQKNGFTINAKEWADDDIIWKHLPYFSYSK